jgi:hypothetical protein
LGRLKSQNSYLFNFCQFYNRRKIPISLSWTKDHTNNMHDETQNLAEKPPSTTTIEQNNSAQNPEDNPLVTTTTEQNNSAPRISNRLKKTPVTMNEDFFWTTVSLKQLH